MDLDFETLFKALLFLAWILSPLFRRKKGAEQQPAPPAPAPPGTARRPEPVRVGRAVGTSLMRGGLDRSIAEATGLLESLDPRLRRLLGPAFEEDILPRAHALIARVSGELPADDPDAASLGFEVQTLLSEHAEALSRARAFVAMRASDTTNPALLNADRIVDALFEPLATLSYQSGLELGPPVAVLDDPARAERTRALLGPEALIVPRRALGQPWRFHSLGHAFGEYLVMAVPGLHGDVNQALDPGPAGSRRDPDAIAQMLAAGWVPQVLPDLVAAGILGPAYLRALAHELRSPGRPDAVTVVPIDRRGYAPVPPHHLRIHAVAAWLDALGEHERVAEELAAWDADHGPPTELRVSGSAAEGRLPLEPAQRALDLAVRDLSGRDLAALGGRGLAELPGLTDWSSVARSAERTRTDFALDLPVDAAPRLVVAAAIDAALDAPATGGAIQNRLSDVLSGRPSGRRARRQSRSRRPASTRGRFGQQEIVEALLLEDLLLRPRG